MGPALPKPSGSQRNGWIRSGKRDHVLTPGRYVGPEAQEDDGEPFEEKMARLSAQWREQQAEPRSWTPLPQRTWSV
jgi:hypothetical protein